MAHIKRRPNRRYRVQFTLNFDLHERYESCRVKAKELRLIIDFSTDFEAWFNQQLDQIERQIAELEDSSPVTTTAENDEIKGGNDEF